MNKDFMKRREEILAIIVNQYVETAEPVSSRYVSRRLGLSSATIRNVMADLEEMGLIMHPYTSAGRVPTDKGYRYYIDALMHLRRVNEHVVRIVEEQYHEAIKSLEDVMEKTSTLLSSLTNYVGIALLPQNEKIYLNGTSHIIEQPEFRDLRKLYAILKCLEAKKEMLNFFIKDLADERLTVHIGRENYLSELSDCSVVTRGYRVRGHPAGRVGVIGPKRMTYEKVIPTIELLADTLSEMLERF